MNYRIIFHLNPNIISTNCRKRFYASISRFFLPFLVFFSYFFFAFYCFSPFPLLSNQSILILYAHEEQTFYLNSIQKDSPLIESSDLFC